MAVITLRTTIPATTHEVQTYPNRRVVSLIGLISFQLVEAEGRGRKTENVKIPFPTAWLFLLF